MQDRYNDEFDIKIILKFYLYIGKWLSSQPF